MENSLETQRRANLQPTVDGHEQENESLPDKMHRKYHVVVAYDHPKPGMARSIRQLSSGLIGSLVVLKGIVIRTDAVKPRLAIATYTCDVCGCETYAEIFRDEFHMMSECQSGKCKENGVAGRLTFMAKHSLFVPSQEIKIQEVPDQL